MFFLDDLLGRLVGRLMKVVVMVGCKRVIIILSDLALDGTSQRQHWRDSFYGTNAWHRKAEYLQDGSVFFLPLPHFRHTSHFTAG